MDNRGGYEVLFLWRAFGLTWVVEDAEDRRVNVELGKIIEVATKWEPQMAMMDRVQVISKMVACM